uniref:Ninjurin n=1 Tax=Anopheles atroparvus TaxID=41427 RepID=A0AAG5DYC7_ANOAO
MTQNNRPKSATAGIDELPMGNNMEDTLIEMHSIEGTTAGERDTDVIERTVEEPLKMRHIPEDSSSLSEVDGGRRSRSNQTHTYDIHKGIAESAMDISLLTANANQLRLLVTYNEKSSTYVACIALVISSLVLQILVASAVIIVKSHPKSKPSQRIYQLKIASSIFVSIITVINILVASLVITY